MLSACDPRFETTAEKCSANQAVRASFVDFSIKASDDEYQPYLQDMLTALQITSTPTEEEQLALDKIDEILKEFMSYEKVDNEFSFTNSLDMLEAMIATTNPATVIETDSEGNERNISLLIETFKLAKQQLADGIAANDGSCFYSNSNIIIENYITENPDTEASKVVFKNLLEVLVRMTYDPFKNTFVHAIALTQTENDPNDPNNPNETIDPFNKNDNLKTIQTSYGGGFEALPSEFKAVGYTLPFTRSVNVTPGDVESSLIIDSFFDSELFVSKKLDVAEYATFDAFCTLKDPDGEIISHDSDTIVLSGDTLSIDPENRIVIDGTTFTINDTAPTINTLIKDGEVLVINNNTFTITGITVVLDKNALLIDSSSLMTISESNVSFSVIECADDIQTVEPIKDQCNGGVDTDENPQTDERNRREARTFDLNTDHTNIKRLRIETDYPANEVRVYVSKYKERILNTPEQEGEDEYVSFLDDPSRCEQQAILDELALLSPGEGVRLTLVPDPAYDLVYKEDEEGNQITDENGDRILDEDQLPTPAYTFTGTEIPTRQ